MNRRKTRWHLRVLRIPKHSFVTVLLVLLQFACNGAAIKCFVCDSSDNPSCADLKSNSSLVAEDCSVNKQKSLKTWLFELNAFAYFETDPNRMPVMNCQKVVAKDPNTRKWVTARFCQLDTADSDACTIVRDRLHLPREDTSTQNNVKRVKPYGENRNSRDDEEEKFHCSICSTDCCNGGLGLHLSYCGTVAAVLMSWLWRIVATCW